LNLSTAPLAVPSENMSIKLFTALKDSTLPEVEKRKETSSKITPRFTPYKRPTKPDTVVNKDDRVTIKPNFQNPVKPPTQSQPVPTATSADTIKPQFSHQKPAKPDFSHKPSTTKNKPSPAIAKTSLNKPFAKPSSSKTPLKSPSLSQKKLKTPSKSPSLSQKNLKTPLKSPRFSQNYNSPSFSDEDDDFEAAMFSIGAALSPSKQQVKEIRFSQVRSSPGLMSAPATPLSKPRPSNTPSASPATPSTKARNKPVIMTCDQVRTHFQQHSSLSKVNAQSLSAFLKVFKVKGLAKMKKQELSDEVVKILVSGHEP